MDVCAHRCPVVQLLVLQVARATGRTTEATRVSIGLTREYVPPVAPVVRDPQQH